MRYLSKVIAIPSLNEANIIRLISPVLRSVYSGVCAIGVIALLATYGAAADDALAVNDYAAEQNPVPRAAEVGDAAYGAAPRPEQAVPEQSTFERTSTQENSAPREGKSVWLEKKIAKPTRWLENLVKPMNIWLEGKIQAPIDNSANQQAERLPSDTLAPDTASTSVKSNRISADEAANAARQHVAGNVLKVKLITMPASQPMTADDSATRFAYRVKLISRQGEIHILYIDALSSALIDPHAKLSSAKPVLEQKRVQEKPQVKSRENEQEQSKEREHE
ncbi:MAG: PepSY domain-containing protein [Pseudomonadales bacterium]